MRLDHIFILASPNAPEANALLDIGLIEGSSNEHPGQGTSNRRFFMANTTIEFLFIHNIAEAMNGAGSKLRLVERAIDIDGSPFGLVTRIHEDTTAPTFPAWHYQPDYFPEDMYFYVGDNSDNFDEPLCICMPPALPPPKDSPELNNADWTLTELQLSIPAIGASTELSTFAECDLVSLQFNKDHRLKLIFNNGSKGESLSLMPDIPLELEW